MTTILEWHGRGRRRAQVERPTVTAGQGRALIARERDRPGHLSRVSRINRSLTKPAALDILEAGIRDTIDSDPINSQIAKNILRECGAWYRWKRTGVVLAVDQMGVQCGSSVGWGPR